MALCISQRAYYSKSGYEIQGDKANRGQVSTLDIFFISLRGRPLPVPPTFTATTSNQQALCVYLWAFAHGKMSRVETCPHAVTGIHNRENLVFLAIDSRLCLHNRESCSSYSDWK